MARIVMPIKNGKLSEYFGTCDYYLIYDVDSKKELGRVEPQSIVPENSFQYHWVSSYKVTDVIAHKMDNNALVAFSDTKINVFIGVTLGEPMQLIEEFERGVLKSNFNSLKAS